MNKLSIWLSAIILLTITAFLVVFKPITFSPRKDPSDASKYLRSISVEKDWDNTMPPVPYTSWSGNKVQMFVYKPQHDLRLGLDLRGGMRVVLEIPDRAEFVYKLTPALRASRVAEEKQVALLAELAKPETLGDPRILNVDADGNNNLRVIVSEQQVKIITLADSSTKADVQNQRIMLALDTVFGKGKYEEDHEKGGPFIPVNAETQASVISTMENRLNGTGLAEMTTYAKGRNQVVLEIPGVKDAGRVNAMLGETAQMDFYLLPADVQTIPGENGELTYMRNGMEVSDADLIKESFLAVPGTALDEKAITFTADQTGKPAVGFGMATSQDKKLFAKITGENVGRHLAIVLDDRIISAPVIKDRIFGSGIISGDFTQEEVKDMVIKLKSGALPVPVHQVETRTVSATLGADSVSASMVAGLIGLAAVLIFMAAYYRLPGLMANCALVIYLFLSFMVLKFFDATLTLPGIAGIIISVGMAVDANVIIFERLKEELRMQKPLETAIDVAFNRAWTAILDSNVASLLTGAVLWWLGTGAVKGFAVTLIIGVVVSLFTAVTVTRLFMKLMIRSKAGRNLAWYGV